jgi:hypothetical protein
MDAAADLRRPDLAGEVVGQYCPPGAILCDDFESGSLLLWENGTPVGCTNDDTLVIDGTRPWRGSHSLHALSPVAAADASSPDGACYLQKVLGTGVSTGSLVVRAYVYTPALLRDWTGLIHFNVSAGNDLHVAVTNNPAVGADGYWDLFYNNPHLGNPQVLQAIGTWQCVEAEMDFAPTRFRLWVTDAAHPDRAAAPIIDYDPGALSPVQSIEVGYYHTPGTVMEETFIDDVAIATSRIGCE